MHLDPTSAERLKVLLERIAQRAHAEVRAIFVPRNDDLALVTQVGVTQVFIDIVKTTWVHRRKELLAGRLVRHGACIVWPTFDGPELSALLFLDRAPADFPDTPTREDGALIGARAPHWGLPSALAPYPARAQRLTSVVVHLLREDLIHRLTTHHGNVAAVARDLGVCRDTVYQRAERLRINIEEFRPLGRRLRPTRA